MPAYIMRDIHRHTHERIPLMHIYIQSWDDFDIEPPDQPDAYELVTDAYPDITASEYPDEESLTEAMYALYWQQTYDTYAKLQDIYPDTEKEAQYTLDHAARILWDHRP